jgi:hypothetical protein
MPSNPQTIADWYARIELHAREHYNEDGWDFFVECWQPEDVQRITEIWHTITYEECLAQIHTLCKIQNDRRRDAQAEAF